MSSQGRTPHVLLSAAALVLMGTMAAQHRVPPVERLVSEDSFTAWQARDVLVAERAALVKALIEIVSDAENLSSNRRSARPAISVLGEYRAAEAAEVLAASIAYPDVIPAGRPPVTPVIGHRVPAFLKPQDHWPAVEALVKIGEPALPAVPALMEKIRQDGCLPPDVPAVWEREQDDEGVYLRLVEGTLHGWERVNRPGDQSLAVLVMIKGRDETEFSLQRALEAETNATRRENLQSAINWLRSDTFPAEALTRMRPRQYRTGAAERTAGCGSGAPARAGAPHPARLIPRAAP